MSKRYIDDGFWTDPYIENLDPIEKMMFIYLLTNPLCNVAGIYEVSLRRLAYETGMDSHAADIILDRFVRDGKLLRVENWIILLNFGKHQVLNPSVESGVRRIWGQIPDWVQAVAACDSLSYFTLLNLTLPNLTKPTATEPKAPVAKKPAKTKAVKKLAPPSDVSVLYYEAVKALDLPVRNHANLQAKIKELEKSPHHDAVIKYLTFVRDQYPNIDWEYKPQLTESLDIYNKRQSIQATLKQQVNKPSRVGVVL